MGTGQSYKGKSNNEFRASILADAVMKLVELYKITRSEIDCYLAILQEESIVTGFGSDKKICDIVDDPEVLSSVAHLVYSEIRSELSLQWDRRCHEPQIEKKVLRDHIHTKYHTEEDPAYYLDYRRLRIMSGLNYEQQLNNRRTLYEIKQIFGLATAELSEALVKYDHESAPVIRRLIQLLMGPKGGEVRSIYERLLRMEKSELKNFHDTLAYSSDNDAIHDLVQLLYRL